MSERSSQVANWLRSLGVARGDRVLLLMPNEVALWETMLACMKLGAVIVPTTTLVSTDDLADRFDRGGVKHVVCTASATPKFDVFPGAYTRVAVGAPGAQAPAGWQDYAASNRQPATFVPDAPTRATDALFLYFTSGTTSKPKLVLHDHQSYPVGHLSTMYWIGLKPGDVHWNISSPGWAKHAWSCLFAPWNAGATIFIYNYARFNAPAVLDVLVRNKVTSLCAPPTVWRMLMQQDLGRYKTSLRELVGAGEPLNPEVIDIVQRAWGITIRDGFGQTETTAQVGNPPGQPVKAGSMGRPLPGYRVELLDADGKPAAEGEICLALSPRPLGLMSGYQDDDERTSEAMRDGHYHTGDVASRDDDGYITYVGRADDVFKARSDPARGPQGHPDPARRLRAQPRARTVHPGLRAFAARVVQAHPHRRVRRAAEDAVGQDPPRRAAPARERAPAGRGLGARVPRDGRLRRRPADQRLANLSVPSAMRE
jgi:acetyl-CoA synthetase